MWNWRRGVLTLMLGCVVFAGANTIRAQDIQYRETLEIHAPNTFLAFPAFSPDGKMIVTLSDPTGDNTNSDFDVWDSMSGQLVITLHLPTGQTNPSSANWSYDSRYLLAVGATASTKI